MGVELRSKHSYLASYLLQEKHKGKESFWYPYLAVLPEKYANMPLFFDEDMLALLKGSQSSKDCGPYRFLAQRV